MAKYYNNTNHTNTHGFQTLPGCPTFKVGSVKSPLNKVEAPQHILNKKGAIWTKTTPGWEEAHIINPPVLRNPTLKARRPYKLQILQDRGPHTTTLSVLKFLKAKGKATGCLRSWPLDQGSLPVVICRASYTMGGEKCFSITEAISAWWSNLNKWIGNLMLPCQI